MAESMIAVAVDWNQKGDLDVCVNQIPFLLCSMTLAYSKVVKLRD